MALRIEHPIAVTAEIFLPGNAEILLGLTLQQSQRGHWRSKGFNTAAARGVKIKMQNQIGLRKMSMVGNSHVQFG
jgi:hypothetical protein